MKIQRFGILAILAAFLFAMCIAPAYCSVIYVKTAGVDTNNGVSWATAKKTVQAAITLGVNGDEIWVASGTYNQTTAPYGANQPQTINLKTGVSLYGGFAGTETLRTQRNPVVNISILDGGGGVTVLAAPPGASATTVLDGFTIRNGRSTSGGGIACISSAMTISNNIITSNTALYYGGGIYVESSAVTIANNTITGNNAPFGAGITCMESASPVIKNNKITTNTASYDGSGIYCYHNTTPIIANNTVTSNTALSEGAGIYCHDSSPKIANNVIVGNTATSNGGGLACLDASPNIANNIVSSCSSGIRSSGTGTPLIRSNCVYGNTSYAYSGISAGSGDLAVSPMFVNAGAGDYHLNSLSPLINAGYNEITGLPTTDIDGQARIQAGAIDIGSDEVAGLPAALTTITGAKTAKANTWINLINAPVTTAFTGYFYIEPEEHVMGIRVDKPSHTLTKNKLAIVDGVIRTNADGERYIYANTANSNGTGSVKKPVFLTIRAIGGDDLNYNPTNGSGQQGIAEAYGPNNIGLLIKTAGIVANPITSTSFYVSDGGQNNVKVVVVSGVSIPQVNQNVSITGISSCEKSGSDLVPVIKVKAPGDITIY